MEHHKKKEEEHGNGRRNLQIKGLFRLSIADEMLVL